MVTYERNLCKNCGAPLDLTRAKGNVVKCSYCGECFILPKEGAGEKVCSFLAIGEHCLDTADFTGAYTAYEKAAQLHQEEPEAYFGMALATAKVQYLKDVVNNRLQPICHEIAKKKVTKDKNYQKAIALATAEQKAEYEKRAREIDEIREKFYEFRHAGLDYDCFLCVKVTGEDGKHTEDSFIASKIYKELKKEGYAPFYSEEEIGERTGSDYEALILYALYTAECMLAVCSDEEYLLTPWVKNEYTRFLRLLSDEEKERDSFAFVFDGTPVERIPGRHGKVQGINFKDGTAMKKIEKFVAVHTPEAKKRREEEAKRKAEEEERKNRMWEEMAQRLRKYEEAEEAAKRADEERRVAEQRKSEEIAAAEAKKHAEAEETRKAEEEKRIAEEFEIEDGVLVEYYGEGGEVIIPDGVTEIGESAFEGCLSITSVTIPDGVTHIGYNAFYGCKALKTVTFGNGIEFIENGAFQDCVSLTSVTIPKGVKAIWHYAFLGCESLQKISLPDGILRICSGAFMGTAYRDDDNNWENDVLYIGTYLIEAFQISGDYRIKEGTTMIAEFAFSGCTLESIAIPASVTIIGGDAFKYCRFLEKMTVDATNPVYKSEGNCILSKDGQTLFFGCVGSVIPCGVKIINCGAFADCDTLEEIEIPYGVTQIDSEAFSGCEGLKKITIPETVTKLDGTAFAGCENLTVYCSKVQSTWDEGWDICGEDDKGNQMHVKVVIVAPQNSENSDFEIEDGVLRGYRGKGGKVIIPGGVTNIGDLAFYGCGALTEIRIPDGVTNIGDLAFRDCGALMEIRIPDGVTNIGGFAFAGCSALSKVRVPEGVKNIDDYAFLNCSSLTSITVPNSVTTIGKRAFSGCSSLTEIRIPDGVTNIGEGTFMGCSALTEIQIPDGVTNIGDSAFSGCDSLTSITMPDGVTEIGESAFESCSSLTTVTIPDSVSKIGEGAFAGCGSLTSVTIPNSVTEIGGDAFGNCSSLTSVKIPDGVAEIGESAFESCSSLTTVTIPDSVSKIGEGAFAGCGSLTSVKIPDGVAEIGDYMFYDCSSLTSITVPNSVTTIGKSAFEGCSSLTEIQIPESVTSIGEYAFFGCKELTVYCNEAQAELVEQTGGAWEKVWDSTKKCYKLRYIK